MQGQNTRANAVGIVDDTIVYSLTRQDCGDSLSASSTRAPESDCNMACSGRCFISPFPVAYLTHVKAMRLNLAGVPIGSLCTTPPLPLVLLDPL